MNNKSVTESSQPGGHSDSKSSPHAPDGLASAETSKQAPAAAGQLWSGMSMAGWSAQGVPDAMSSQGSTTQLGGLTGNKEQLHHRVSVRMAELEEALAQLEGRQSHGERALAIATSIDTAKASMSGGWERVGEMEAAQLSKWLQTSEDLRVTAPTAALAPTPALEA
ncbi:MAG TPA: hypothetical protein PLA87_21155 [Pseudomonadota bacterium]|nr:hypothetical protein [Pseudomonadota bacterium]